MSYPSAVQEVLARVQSRLGEDARAKRIFSQKFGVFSDYVREHLPLWMLPYHEVDYLLGSHTYSGAEAYEKEYGNTEKEYARYLTDQVGAGRPVPRSIRLEYPTRYILGLPLDEKTHWDIEREADEHIELPSRPKYLQQQIMLWESYMRRAEEDEKKLPVDVKRAWALYKALKQPENQNIIPRLKVYLAAFKQWAPGEREKDSILREIRSLLSENLKDEYEAAFGEQGEAPNETQIQALVDRVNTHLAQAVGVPSLFYFFERDAAVKELKQRAQNQRSKNRAKEEKAVIAKYPEYKMAKEAFKAAYQDWIKADAAAQKGEDFRKKGGLTLKGLLEERIYRREGERLQGMENAVLGHVLTHIRYRV